jgi:filamin
LSIEGPSKADIECHDNDDGSCRVTYRPTEPGTYVINIKFADKHVPGSPFTVNVSGPQLGNNSRLTERVIRERKACEITQIGSQCELSLKIPNTNRLDMAAYVNSPSGHIEDCEIVDLDDCNYCIRFVPKEMGIHTVSIKHRDMHIPGSPFEFTVGKISGGGSHKVRATGQGLIKGEVNQPCDFNIYTREAGAGALSIAVEGPAKAEIDFHDRKDGTCGVSFVCSEPGEYEVSVKFNDEHIPDSPFRAHITQPIGDGKRLTVHSLRTKGLEVNKPFSFSINVNGARGKLDARVISPSGNDDYAIIQDMGDDNYSIRFIPHENGVHWIHVYFNDIEIAESPFRVSVGQLNADPGRVYASGNGLHQGETGRICEFQINTMNAGAGALAVTVDGPAKVELDCKEMQDGYRVRFVPCAPGDYLITIKFVGVNIAGSPFKCHVVDTSSASSTVRTIPIINREHSNIVFETVEKNPTGNLYSINSTMTSDASKVRVKGSGVYKAFRNQRAQFTVDTNGAGSNMLMVGVYGPKQPCDEVVIKHIGNQQYQVTYCVKDKGQHMLLVKYGDQHIPGSPFQIEVV